MNDIESFLRECVFYPCSALHGLPIKLLSSRFTRFFYADYSVDREKFNKAIKDEGFKGYQFATEVELTPDSVFGVSWKDLRQEHHSTISRVHGEWFNPFVVLCRFERAVGFDDSHGPPSFELLFARCEAISSLKSAFSRRNIAPKCLVHIRSGIGFGGGFSEYPRELSNALLVNRGGLPAFMLYDRMGSDKEYGDYLDLIERYEECERWGYPDGGFVAFARLMASDGEQGAPADRPAAASRRKDGG